MTDYNRCTFGVALCIGLLLLMIAAGSVAARYIPTADTSNQAKNSADSVKMARATWDTGWFQAEIYKQLMEALGYRVEGPSTMSNWGFYQAVGKGSVDLWVNAWLPSHNAFLEQESIQANVEVIGYAVKSGALQGYLVDEKTARTHGINTLTDLEDPTIAKLFDRDGNGKADLVGCNIGWGCELVIEHQLAVYGLNQSVEHIQGDYSPLMAETVARYHRGEPILFYTWTPNWTVGTLKPGKDVRWLEVPFASLPEGQKDLENRTVIDHVPGCPRSPCVLGFPPNDIRAVANRSFIRVHPDIRRVLEQVEIPLADISQQNARMIDGEDSFADIQIHAEQWIRDNRRQVDRWLAAARPLQPMAGFKRSTKSPSATPETETPVLKVVTQRTEPFVIYRNQRYEGFTIELWDRIAGMLGLEYRVYGVNTIAKLMDEIQRGAADVAVSGIGITSSREKTLDFSHTFLVSGLQIMVSEDSDSILGEVVLKVLAVIFAPELLFGVGLFLLVLIAAAHVNWLFERGHNPQFSNHYAQGIWQSIWWAVVTVTTVGYGDKTPTGKRGRFFGIIWILAGYFVFAYFTATVTSTVTIRELHSFINEPEDLYGKRVATVEKSTAADYLTDQGIASEQLRTIDEAFHLLENGKMDAVVYDAPVLQHYARSQGKGKVKVVGVIFQKKSYGFALPVGSDIRDKINVALLELIEDGDYQEIRQKWFGK